MFAIIPDKHYIKQRDNLSTVCLGYKLSKWVINTSTRIEVSNKVRCRVHVFLSCHYTMQHIRLINMDALKSI